MSHSDPGAGPGESTGGARHEPAGGRTGGTSDSEQTQERVRETAAEAQQAARERAEQQFQQQTHAAADQTGKAARVFHKMADEFEQQNQPMFSGAANNLARYSDSLAESLRNKDMRTLADDAQQFSRRQPAVFIGGAIAGGFLLARFLRSSQAQDGSASAERSPQHDQAGSHGRARQQQSQQQPRQQLGQQGRSAPASSPDATNG